MKIIKRFILFTNHIMYLGKDSQAVDFNKIRFLFYIKNRRQNE